MTKKEQLLYRKMHGDKALKQLNNSQRNRTNFNTGTRVIKTSKDYTRKEKHKKKLTDLDF